MSVTASRKDDCLVADAADPDVTGLGVVVAFLISICLSAIAAIYLYISQRLPGQQYNRIDKVVLQCFPERLTESTVLPRILKRLLLTLSDQQLASSAALILAIYIKLSDRDAFSTYSFRVATTSVWLSCVTHVTAVTALKNDFYPRTGRGWRVGLGVFLLLLLAPLVVISNLPTFIADPALSFRCAWDQIPTYDRGRTAKFALIATSTLLLTIGGYATAIIAMYGGPRQPSPLDGEEKIALKRKLMRQKRRMQRQGRDDGSLQHEEVSRYYRHDHSRHRPSNSQNQSGYIPIPWRHILVPLVDGVRKSFLRQLIRLAFYFTFGITSLVTAWMEVSPAKQWATSFGQLIPLILLMTALPPLFEAAEAQALGRVIHLRHLPFRWLFPAETLS